MIQAFQMSSSMHFPDFPAGKLDATCTSRMMQNGRFSLRRPDHEQLTGPSDYPGHCATMFQQVRS